MRSEHPDAKVGRTVDFAQSTGILYASPSELLPFPVSALTYYRFCSSLLFNVQRIT